MTHTDALLKLEEQRCEAISSIAGGSRDEGESALRATLSDDYVHVHATSAIDDASGFIAGVVSNPRRVERGPIDVRVCGPFAVMIGEQISHRGDTVIAAVVTQIAAIRAGQWKFISAQVTRKA